MHFVLTVLLLFFLASSFKFTLSEYEHFFNNYSYLTEENIIKYSCDIIYAHAEFEAMFHFDGFNLLIMEELLMHLSNISMKGVNLILYGKNTTFGKLFKRPVVRKVLHVVVLSNVEEFSLFLNTSININENDEALFIITNKTADLTFLTTDLEIKIFGKVLVVNVNEEGKVTVSSVCYYCGSKSQKLFELPLDTNNVLFRRLFEKKDFNNFHHHKFKVGFVDYFPFIWCDEVVEIIDDNETDFICTKDTTQGSDYELISLMGRQLNFNFWLYNYVDYAELLDDLTNKKIDFVIGGLSPTPERLRAATMTRPYKFEAYTFLYVLGTSLNQELRRVFDPFEGYLWLLLVCSIFVTSGVLYMLDRSELKSISCVDSFWVCLHMAIEQNVRIKKGFKVRLGPSCLLIAWILVCLNVSTAYKSKLSSIVMNPPYKEPSSLAELIAEDYTFVVNEGYSDVFMTLLFNTTDSTVQTALSLTETREDLCDEFIYAVENRAAILDEYTALQYGLRKTCKNEIEKMRSQTETASGTNIRITHNSLRNIGHTWLLQKRAVYKTTFDLVLGRVIEAGLLSIWTNPSSSQMRNGTFPESHNNSEHFYSPLSLKLLLSLFFIYAIGNCTAVIMFLLELWLHNKAIKVIGRKFSLMKAITDERY